MMSPKAETMTKGKGMVEPRIVRFVADWLWMVRGDWVLYHKGSVHPGYVKAFNSTVNKQDDNCKPRNSKLALCIQLELQVSTQPHDMQVYKFVLAVRLAVTS